MTGDDRLDSWKEIAAYLGREVRTVQLWEKSEGLPVHRHQHGRQGSVYAFKSELDVWQKARRVSPPPSPAASVPATRLHLRPIAAAALLVACVAGFLLWKRTRRETMSSVVVLPFLDFSPGHDQEYFSDGLTEEIIDALSRVPDLRVVARTSAFAFKGKANDIRQIGKQLNVDVVLEGSVRKAGDAIRITAQLNRVSDGYHLWSRTYDRQLRDVFAIQREISQSIADQLRVGAVPLREPTHNLEAYRLYQEGRYFFNQFQPPDSNRKAIERYQQAIERDPQFALAYAGLSEAYAYLAENFVVAPNEVMPKAREAAEKAVALDPDSAEAHTSLGAVKLDYEWDRDGAQRELQKALQLNPGSGWVHHWYAHSLETQNRLYDAMREMRTALDLDPLSIPINWDIGSELLYARRYPEALRHVDKAMELFPNVPLFGFEKAEAYYCTGDSKAAHAVVQKMKSAGPEILDDPFFIAFFGSAAAREGRRAEALQTLDRLERLRKKQYVEPIMAIELCSALNDRERLGVWMKRASEERSTLYLYLPLLERIFDNNPGTRALLSFLH